MSRDVAEDEASGTALPVHRVVLDVRQARLTGQESLVQGTVTVVVRALSRTAATAAIRCTDALATPDGRQVGLVQQRVLSHLVTTLHCYADTTTTPKIADHELRPVVAAQPS